MNELKEKLLELMGEIHDICQKYGITYYGEGGTVIGALRHEGFIPWDDDMDVVMTRDNFNKFVEAFKKENLPNRILEFPEGNKDYPVVTVKYNDTSTASIFRSLMLDVCASGVNIDIFILDPIPKGREEWFKKNFLAYTEILCPYYILNKEASSAFRYYLDLLKVKIFGRDKVLEKYRKMLFNFTEEEAEEYLVRWPIVYQTVKIDYYGKPRFCKFEDMEVAVPEKAESVLSGFFGDSWYILPEAEDQVTHDVVHNMNRSYMVYESDYMRFIDKKKAIKHHARAKRVQVLKLKAEREDIAKTNELNAIAASLDLRSKLTKEKAEELFNEKKYGELEQYTAPFINEQGRGMYRKFGLKMDVDADIAWYAMMGQINVGKFYNVSSFIHLYQSEKFAGISDTIKKLQAAKKHYYEGSYDAAVTICDELLKESPDNLSAYKIKLDILVQSEIASEDRVSLMSEIEGYYDRTGDIELKKYLGDIYLQMGEKDKAFELYNMVKGNTRNGLILLDIEKKM